MERDKLDLGGKKYHPNSIRARAGYDRQLMRRLVQGERRAIADIKAMESWAAGGFGGGISYS